MLLFSESRLAAAAGAGGSVWAGGCILHGAGLYPCLGGDRQHSNTLALFFGTSGIIGSVVIALAYLRNAGAAMRCAVVVVALMVLIRLIMQPLWLADINAVDTTVVTFPHHPLQALAQLRDVYLLGWCVSAAGMLCFAAGGLRNARGTLVAGSVLLLLGEIMLRYVFFSIG